MTVQNSTIHQSLEVSAPAAAHRLRGALAEALASMQFKVGKPLHFSRELGVDKSLGWKISRFVTEDDAVAAIRHLPGRPGMKIVVDRLTACGVPVDLLERVGAAIEQFERVIEEHAGDRDSFDLMLSSLSPGVARERHESFRRQAFAGNSAIWGVQARLQLAVHVVAPGSEPGMVDLALTGGLVDFRRLRSDVAWAVARAWRFTGTGESVANARLPIDPSASAGGPPVMTAFSTKPLPAMLAREEPDKLVTRFEIDAGPIGNSGACTVITGWKSPNFAGVKRTASDRFGEHLVSLSTPVEMLYLDLYAHKSLAFAHWPRAQVFSQLPGGAIFPRDGHDAGRLELPMEILRLGGGVDGPPAVANHDYASHRELVEATVGSLGHDIADFVGLRVRLAYPPIPTVALFRYDLPE